MLLDSLDKAATPKARDAVSLWRRHKNDLAAMMKEISPHGRSLVDLGCERDIEFAASLNKYDILPVREGEKIVRKDK
jgi:phosphosulfolactate phosphohydrolase-like enzyme